MVKLNFPGVSSGYLGLGAANATLASQWYSALLSGKLECSSKFLMLFPQRVPTLDFFSELLDNEVPSFRDDFEVIRSAYRKELAQLSTIDSTNQIYACNLIDICARLGLLGEVSQFGKRVQIESGTPFLSLRIAIYQSALEYSLGEVVDLTPILQLTREQSPLLRALAVSRFIVTCIRQTDGRRLGEIRAQVAETFAFVKNFNPSSGLEYAWKSMILRALPMLPEVPNIEKQSLLNSALKMAEDIAPGDSFEALAKQELLLTTHLSIAKFAENLNDLDAAQVGYSALLQLDGNDPVAHTENAMFFYRRKSWAKALPHFLKAIELGPPNFAMNTYFAGKCFLELGDSIKAIEYFELCISRDHTALSPHLDLLDLHTHLRNADSVRSIAKCILESADLREQLNEHEVRTVQNAL